MKFDINYTEYFSLADYLLAVFESLKNKNKNYSLRSFSKSLGYKNPSFLSDILKKKRKPNKKLVLKFSKQFTLPFSHQQYLLKICDFELAKSPDEKDSILKDIKILMKNRNWSVYSLDQYEFLTNLNTTILYSLIALKDFEPSESFLKKHLNFPLNQQEINEALKILMQIGHIQKNGKSYNYSTPNTVMMAGDLTIQSQAILKFHLNQMAFARELIRTLPAESRDIRTTTLAIPSANFPAARDLIQELHEKISLLAVDKNADQALYFTTQLIPLTKKS